MNRRRRSKTLEKAARAVRDNDEFVDHVFNIARGFAAHHALDAGAGTRGVRQSLRAFERHASALTDWLKRSTQRGSAEHEAIGAIAAAEVDTVREWLHRNALAARKAESDLQGKKLRQAPRFAAQALRATFEHHGLKVSHRASATKQSDAVTLLCAIARDGGDASVTPPQARQWLIESARP